MYKRNWVYENDIVLVSLRDFEYNKADIIHRYSKKEADYLKRNGHIPENGKNRFFGLT